MGSRTCLSRLFSDPDLRQFSISAASPLASLLPVAASQPLPLQYNVTKVDASKLEKTDQLASWLPLVHPEPSNSFGGRGLAKARTIFAVCLAMYLSHVFKSHLDKHLRESVEQAFTHSGILMRPLMSAAAIGSFPFLCDFLGKEGAKVVQVWPRAKPINNFGLAVYMLFCMPIFLRSLLMLGRASTSWWNRSWFRYIVIACQAVSLLLMSLLFIVGYLVCIAVSKDDWTRMTSPMDPLPLYLLSLVVLCSVTVGLRHLCSCRKSVIIGGAPAKARKNRASPPVGLGPSDAKDVHAPEMTAGTSVVSEESTFEI